MFDESRFSTLCRFLHENKDKYNVIGFNDISDDIKNDNLLRPVEEISVGFYPTIKRYCEQAIGRLF